VNPNAHIQGQSPDRNPFSTRSTRPGAIPYRFSGNLSAANVVDHLRDYGWWGEIVGPHGTGKSTLLSTLLPLLRNAGRDVHSFRLRGGESRLPVSLVKLERWGTETQLIVDGYEQLGAAARSTLKRMCRKRQSGLLVTTHESVGLPPLCRTSVSVELAQRLVAELTAAVCPLITPEDVEQSYRLHPGNLREVFFELYDVYESRKPV